jgi:hypothetical protein
VECQLVHTSHSRGLHQERASLASQIHGFCSR